MTPQQAKEFLPIIEAYANGKQIQHNDGTETNPMWTNNTPLMFDDSPKYYRIKPETKKYRIAEIKSGFNSLDKRIVIYTSENNANLIQQHPAFIRWITDWIEYE